MAILQDMDPDDEVSDSGAECVICMSDMRDTLILPCRHLCLCSTCADSLRYQVVGSQSEPVQVCCQSMYLMFQVDLEQN